MNNLIEIKNKIETFELFQCGMYHEKVKLDKKTKLPLKTNIQNENNFLRVNLCNSELRKKRLGCAHSSVNLHFNQLMDRIESKEIKKIKQKFNQTIIKVYELDHQKGNLEKELAEIRLKTPLNLDEKKQALNRIDTCINLHKSYINDLRIIKNKLIKIIDYKIQQVID